MRSTPATNPAAKEPADISHTPYRTIWRLAWPQVLMTLTHFLIGAVDVWAAGRIDSAVQASLGQVSQLLLFFMVVGIAAANGAVAAISQSVGAGLMRRVRRYVGLCIELAAGAGVLILALGLLAKPLLLDMLLTPDAIRPVTAYFLDFYVLILPAYYVVVITNAIFRAQKKVLYPLYCGAILTLLNTAGDLGLGLGWWGLPELGYQGLAWSTLVAVTVAAAFNLVMLVRLGMLARDSFAPWRWVRRAVVYLFRVAWPVGLMSLVWNASYLVLFALAAGLPGQGQIALAGLTVGNRIEAILFLPAFGFNMTAGILVGHFLGARRPGTAKVFGWRIAGIGLVSISALTLLAWTFAPELTAFFAPDPAVSAETIRYLRYNLAAMPFTVVGMILAGALGGAGATIYNLWSVGISAWLVRIPLAWWLGYHSLDRAEGIWIAMAASQVLQCLILLFFYSFRDWSRYSLYAKPGHRALCKETVHGTHPAQIRSCKP